MKREYMTPEAEKMTFDYTESVVASAADGLGNSRHDDAPGPGVHWVCAKCWEYDNWIDQTGMCQGHY